ncbi:MAG TPA: leucine--tRNA ligase, partial [Pyrinomonadaceae bacterium]|nr:leucine--tRNA ligase [Pyrinomonadaceae bacterium]
MAEIESGWPASVLKRQSDWIGRSEGAFVDFRSADTLVRVFTTRIDTIYGANAVVVAAEHPIIAANRDSLSADVIAKVDAIIAENLKPKERDEEVEKDGIDTGLKAVNPFSHEEIPIWVGNYVMMDYGTGAVMSVPAHDERDFEFAKKFDLPIRQVISEPHMEHAHHAMQAMALEDAFTEYGVLVHSDYWNGKTSDIAKKEMTEFAEKHGFGEGATTYRLRDWGISRQRFWGSPIPMIYCDECGVVPEKIENLPVELPETAPFTGTGESPLAKVPEFYETNCPNCGKAAKRETDTMDTFVDSSWYYYRYTDAQNSDAPFDTTITNKWTPVDQYIGGDDHAVMHLIYARFWTKAMRDMGLVNFDEPFRRLLTQGMVVGETFFDDASGKRVYYKSDEVNVERDQKGRISSANLRSEIQNPKLLRYAIERMSKSKGNGVDPDEMVEIYGADASRLFVMFAAPIENELVWNEAGIEGAVRFLQRVWRQVYKWKSAAAVGSSEESSAAKKLRQKTHQTIKRVSDSFEELQFNTPVAALMELSNAIGDVGEPESADTATKAAVAEALNALVLMLTPFSPHVAEDLYSVLVGNENGIVANNARFPEYNEDLAKADEIEVAVQVNGKLRGRVFASPDATNSELESLALAEEKVAEHTAGKDIVKVIVVPGRLVNVVVKG